MTGLSDGEHKALRLNKKIINFESHLRSGVVALSKRAEHAKDKDEALKFSQASLNLATAVATLRRLDQGDN